MWNELKLSQNEDFLDDESKEDRIGQVKNFVDADGIHILLKSLVDVASSELEKKCSQLQSSLPECPLTRPIWTRYTTCSTIFTIIFLYSDKTLSRRHLSCRYEKRYEEAQEGLSRITQDLSAPE